MLGLGSSAVLGKKLLSEKTVETLKKKKNG
jgi:hypothetical protein